MHRFLAVVALVALLPLASCTRETSDKNEPLGAVVLRGWAHAGQEPERNVLRAQVARFNAEQDSIQVELTLLPEGSYNAQVQAAALAGDLPDLLEFDGPFVYSYVWQGQLVAIDGFVDPSLRDSLLPSILAQGTYRGHLYALGQFDSGLGLYGRRGQLKAIGARIPSSPAEAWTADELQEILAGLARLDRDHAVLDLKLNYEGEWFTYAFSPVVESAGGDLIDRTTYESASGTLDKEVVIAAMAQLQSWITRRGYVDPNLDDDAFVGGRVALSWAGHWEYPRYAEKYGDDLVLLPLPDFGEGSRTGMGSWNWGVTARCAKPGAAVTFIEYLLEDQQILEMTAANGAVPATWSAIEKSPLYAEGGALHLFVVQLAGGFAVPRPQTPAYPFITSVFQQAFDDIRVGGDVAEALGEAATAIDRDLRDNQGYPDTDTR